MDGHEIQTHQDPDGHWEAKDGELTGIGPTEDEAQRDLLRIKTQTPDSPKVSELTQANKAKVTDAMNVEVSRLITTKLRNPAKIDGVKYDYLAYYSDDPNVQGYGNSEVNARLNLFSKKKAASGG